MTDQTPDSVTCPNCDSAYRWKPALAGRTVACKKCGEGFVVNDQPGVGTPVAPDPTPDPEPAIPAPSEPDDDADVYDLAIDPDEEPAPPPPPAFKPEPSAAEQAGPFETASDTAASAPPFAPSTAPPSSDALPEEPKHVNEAVRAARREEQRIAAAQAESAKSWRDYKGLITLAAIAGLIVLIIVLMFVLSDQLEGFLDFSMGARPQRA